MHVYLVDSISNPTKREYQGFMQPNGQLDKDYPELSFALADVKRNGVVVFKAVGK